MIVRPSFANPMTALGQLLYGGSGGSPTALNGNTSATKQFLTQIGTGSTSAEPAWGTLAASDMAALLSTSSTWTAGQLISLAPGANAVGDGLELLNATAATSSEQQYSPAVHWSGRGWETATGASQAVDFRAYASPVQGAATSGSLTFDCALNGGAYSPVAELQSNGNLQLASNTLVQFGGTTASYPAILGNTSAGRIDFSLADKSALCDFYAGGFYIYSGEYLFGVGATDNNVRIANSSLLAWGSGDASSSLDTALFRNAAGVVEVNNGTAGTFRDLLARSVRSNGVTFSSAVSSPAVGTVQCFTDSTVNSYGATVTGGGSDNVLGWYNGTNWVVLGGVSGGGGLPLALTAGDQDTVLKDNEGNSLLAGTGAPNQIELVGGGAVVSANGIQLNEGNLVVVNGAVIASASFAVWGRSAPTGIPTLSLVNVAGSGDDADINGNFAAILALLQAYGLSA